PAAAKTISTTERELLHRRSVSPSSQQENYQMATTYSESTDVGGRALIEGGPVASRRVSWGAILAGSVVAVAISTMLHLLGAGIGAASIDATGGTTPSASAFTTGAA